MWRDSRLAELLGIDLPIVQAPMAGATTPALAAAVSNAGGLGSLGCAMHPPEAIGDLVAEMRGLTNGAFNLNFFAHAAPRRDPEALARTLARLAPHYEAAGVDPPAAEALPDFGPGFTPAHLEALLADPPPVVSFHFGLPEGDAVARLREKGARVLCSATTVAEAKALEAAGVDAVIAQGWEAGGHRGAFEVEPNDCGVGLMSLLPQVVDAVSILVIAAGGIADGRGVAAAFALGAAGVQIGTAYLACPEAGPPPDHRAAVRAARDDDTRLTRAFTGRPARARRTDYIDGMAGAENLVDFPLLRALTAPLAAGPGGGAYAFYLYGQSAALSREMGARELTLTIADEADRALAGLA